MSTRKRAAAAAAASPGAASSVSDSGSTSAPASVATAEAAVAGASTPATPALPSTSKPHSTAARYASTRHWLMKNEPPYSLSALRLLPSQTEPWVGVRSHEARNIMVHSMKQGQEVLYYNASVPNPHVALARVASGSYPDHTAWDRASPYFDAKSIRSQPTWHMVDVRYQREFARPVYLAEMRLHSGPGGALEHASLFRRNRLSIHALSQAEFEFICGLALTPLPQAVKLKPEKAGQATQAHPSRNRHGGAGAASSKRKKAAAATAEADNSESATLASSSVVAPFSPDAVPTAQRRKLTRGSTA